MSRSIGWKDIGASVPVINNALYHNTPEARQAAGARQGFVKARTAQANQIRGLLAEYGIVIPQGIGHIAKRLPEILEDGENDLPGAFRQLLDRLGDHLKELDRQVGELEVQIQSWHRENEASKKLAQIPGIGPITASALVASIGDAKSFENGRQLAAWLGLVPRQHSSGGKQVLLGISKRGDTYLRTLLIHGARAVIRVAERKAGYARQLARAADGPAQQERGGGGAGEQERPHRLGAAGAWPGLPGRL